MTLKLGVLGTGRIADMQHGPAIAAARGVELWSVLSRDRARAVDFAARHGARAATPAHDSLDAMLADESLDAVLIATPDRLHLEQAVAAAAAGKHVLTEKPMAASVAECEAMLTACADAGVQLGLAYHLRWHAGHRALHAAIQAGRLGQLRHVRLQWTSRQHDASGWRAQPEVGRWWSLAAVGTHCVDLARWFMLPTCGKLRSVRSVINRSVLASTHDQTAVVALQFDDGATAEICTSVLFSSPTRLELYGAEGYALAEGTLGAEGRGRIEIDGDEFAFTPTNPFVGEIEDFAHAVRDARPPEVDGAEGLANVRILEAACPA